MGFFYNENGKQKKFKEKMPIHLMHEHQCKVCPRNQKAAVAKLHHPKMEPTGSKMPTIYMLGEAPGENEDLRGRQFVGKSGKYIREHIPKRWEKWIRWNNTIRCRPPQNRNPLPQEIECCRPKQESDIEKYKPEVIILVGRVPTTWLMGTVKQGINAWRGRLLPVKVGAHVCWAFPILHPAGVLRQSGGKYESESEKIFARDLKRLFKMLDNGLPSPIFVEDGYSDGIRWIGKGDKADIDTIHRELDAMSKEKICSIDIETKRLRPYYDDARIVSCSVTTKKYGTFVFPLARKDFWISEALEEIAFKLLKKFISTSVRKICHNATFEQEWFAYYFGIDVVLKTQWEDTMAMAYCRDSRKGMLNLDILILMHFGFRLKALSDVDVRKDLDKYTVDEVSEYNGLDSKWTYELYLSLRSIIRKEKLRQVVAQRVRMGIVLVGAQIEGVPVSQTAANKIGRKLEKALEAQNKLGRKTRPWKKFVAKVGRDPNPESTKDMAVMFDEIMHVKEVKTASGGISTAEPILSKLSARKYPVAPIVLEYRSINTVKGTFVDTLSGHTHSDGRLHTNYGHLYTASGRSNSEDPNLQNWPKHHWKEVRLIIKDSDGNLWVISFDYAQIEARVIAMASQDPVFVQMLWDEYDVHGEWAQRIHDEYNGCLKAMGIKGRYSDLEVAKKYRQEVKNKFVFPLFFGSSAYSVSGNLNLPPDVTSYLVDEFWSVFEGILEWQKEVVSLYKRRGYVETLTGLRRYGPCSYNEVINHPIQGTANDIAIDAACRLQDKGIQFNMYLHDDLTFIMENDKKQIRKIAREMCRPTFDFINVPFVIEVEGGPNWFDQKPIGVYASDKDFGFH